MDLSRWAADRPSPANAYWLGNIVLQSLFFALALGVLRSHVRAPVLAPFAILAAALWFAPHPDALTSIWPPHVLAMPFLCFMIASASVGAGRVNHLPLLALIGGFLFHGHVAQPLFVGGLGATAIVLCARRLRHEHHATWRDLARLHRRTLAWCIALAFVFLLPIAIDVATRGLHSNVATIVGQFYKNADEGNSPLQGLLYFLSFATPARNQEVLFDVPGPQTTAFLLEHGWRIAAWLGVLVLRHSSRGG